MEQIHLTLEYSHWIRSKPHCRLPLRTDTWITVLTDCWGKGVRPKPELIKSANCIHRYSLSATHCNMHCGQDIFSTYARYPESPQPIQFKTKKYTTRNKAQEFATICQRKRNCDLAIWFSARYTWKWDTWYISPKVYAFLGEYGKALSWASIYSR